MNVPEKEDALFHTTLNDLSDDLLLLIFANLDSTSHYMLSRVNRRLENLILDRTFWRKIEARAEPHSVAKSVYMIARVQPSTTQLCLYSCERDRDGFFLARDLSLISAATHLTILALENQTIEGDVLTIRHFPGTLQELSFRRSLIKKSGKFFRRSRDAMTKLRVLMLDECYWVNSLIIMSVSKYESLQVLSLSRCQIDPSTPYFGLAAWNGFRTLKVLDIRMALVGDSLLQAMVRCVTIPAIYFQCCMSAVQRGTQQEELTDRGTSDYHHYSPLNEPYDPPKSYLYTEPYAHVCQCGGPDKWGNDPPGPPDQPGPSGRRDDNDDSDDDDDKDYKNDHHRTHHIRDYLRIDSGEPTKKVIIGVLSPAGAAGAAAPCDENRHRFHRVLVSQDGVDHIEVKFQAELTDEPSTSRKREAEAANIFPGGPPCKITVEEASTGSETQTTSSSSDPTTSESTQTSSGDEVIEIKESSEESAQNEIITIEDSSKDDSPIEEIIPLSPMRESPPEDAKHSPNDDHFEDITIEESPEQVVGESSNEPMQIGALDEDDEAARPLPSPPNEEVLEPANSPPVEEVREPENPPPNEEVQEPGDSPPNEEAGEPDVQVNRAPRWAGLQGGNVPVFIPAMEIAHAGAGADDDVPGCPFRDENVFRIHRRVCMHPNHGQGMPERFVGLKRLSCRNYDGITDRTLHFLNHLNMELLDVTGTNVTPAGLRWFMHHNPECIVIHRDICRCRPKRSKYRPT